MKCHDDDRVTETTVIKKAGRARAVLGEQKAQGHLVSMYKYWMGVCKEDGARLSSVVPSNRIKAMDTN